MTVALKFAPKTSEGGATRTYQVRLTANRNRHGGDLHMATNPNSQIEWLLCFNLGHQEFAARLPSIREIISVPESLVSVQNTPEYFLGLVNLRGNFIPLIDIRKKLKIATSANKPLVVAIVDLAEVKAALLIESVNQVLSTRRDQIFTPEESKQPAASSYLSGVLLNNGAQISILDLTKLIDARDQTTIQRISIPKIRPAAA